MSLRGKPHKGHARGMTSFLISHFMIDDTLTAIPSLFAGLSLTCYECENCQENEPYLRNHMRQCADSTYISCLMTESKFAHHKSKFKIDIPLLKILKSKEKSEGL